MHLILPPSETKREGGREGSSLDLASLGFPRLSGPRRRVLAALRSLGQNRKEMSKALKLGPTQGFEIDRNRQVRRSPTLPAIERYTGVLYDALGSRSLGPAAMKFASSHILIHSALFGLLRASDPIPAYRLSHDSQLGGLSLRDNWHEPITAELVYVERGDGGSLVLDLRSESYVALGAAPPNSWYLRVVSDGQDGRVRALNHFNKQGKGVFVRAVLDAGIDHDCIDSLIDWAATSGIRLSRAEGNQLLLVV